MRIWHTQQARRRAAPSPTRVCASHASGRSAHARAAGSASAQRSYGNFMAAMNAQPQFNTIKQAINFLSLAPTFSNPQLKVTVFAPTDSVSESRWTSCRHGGCGIASRR